MTRKLFKLVGHFALALSIGSAVIPAAAQPPPPPAPAAEAPPPEPPTAETPEATEAPAADDLATVVVTARRIEEKGQDVPISMTLFNQEQLTDKNVSNGVDLATYTPSLATNSEFGTDNTSFSIRGFSQQIGTSASVAVYFADVVEPRGGAGGINAGDGAGPGAFFDLQNVQVLKGPQGTLFGRNTDGGAILLVPQKPTNEWEGFVDGGYGNFNEWRAQGVYNAPLASTFKMRFGFDHEDRQGYMKNLSSIGPKDFNDVGYTAARASAVWDITPNLENYTIASYVNSSHNGSAQKLVACNRSLETGGIGPLGACEQLRRDQGSDFWSTENDLPMAHTRLNQFQVVNDTTWTVNDNFSVKNIASYAQLRNTIYNDLFGTNFSIPDKVPRVGGTPFYFTNVIAAPGYDNNDESTTTEELRAAGNWLDNRLTWQGGGYAEFNEPVRDSGQTSGTTISCTNILALQCFDVLGAISSVEPGGGGQGSAGTVNYQVGAIRFHDYGIYEQSTFAITDTLKFTEGLRYTLDSAQSNFRIADYRFPAANTPELYCITSTSPYAYKSGNASVPAPSPEDCEIHLKKNSYAPTWTTGLDYKLTTSELLYGKYSRGYRQGSVNPTGPEGANTWNPEKVESFELGSKTSFEHYIRGTFDVAAFFNNFRDQQLSEGFFCPSDNMNCGAQPNQGIVNAGHSRIWGLETDSAISPFKGMTIAASYAYLNSRLVSITQVVPPPGSPYGDPQSNIAAGSDLPLTPKQKISSNATYVFPLAPNKGRLSIAVGYTYQSGEIQTGHGASPDFYKTKGYGLTSANLDWKAVAGSRFDVGLFATNMFNQRYVVYVAGLYTATGFESEQVGEPALYGGHIRMAFGD